MDEFRNYYQKSQYFASGIGVNYGPSMIIAKEVCPIAEGDGTEIESPTAYVKLLLTSKQGSEDARSIYPAEQIDSSLTTKVQSKNPNFQIFSHGID